MGIVKKASKGENTLRFMLRNVWDRSCLKWDALRRIKKGPNQYECEECHKIFKLREVHVDHLHAVVNPDKGWEGIQTFAWRLLCPSNELQVLCIDNCHKNKTEAENARRKAQRRLSNS